MNTHPMVNTWRQSFPFFSQSQMPYLYFDNAATSQKPQVVIDAISDFYRYSNGNVHRSMNRLAQQATHAFEAVRGQVAAFINAPDAKHIVFTKGTTESINMVAQGFVLPQLQAGDEILVSGQEHHANLLPWIRITQQTGARLVVVPPTEDLCFDLEAFKSKLHSKTRFIALTHISNALGIETPIKDCIKMAKRLHIPILVDGAQAALHRQLDVCALDCDFYVFSAHKCLGPTGVGVLYGKAERLEQTSPWLVGGEMVAHASYDTFTAREAPQKLEAGTPNIAGVMGFGAALRYLESASRTQMWAYEAELTHYLKQSLSSYPHIKVLTHQQHNHGIVSVQLLKHHLSDAAEYLSAKGIVVRTGHHCAQPLMKYLGIDGTLRFSLAFYNQKEEVDRVVESLGDFLNASTHSHAAPLQATPVVAELLKSLASSRYREQQLSILNRLAKSMDSVLQRETAIKVEECESQVWVQLVIDQEHGTDLIIDSEARVIKGIGKVLSHHVQGLSATALLEYDFEALLNHYHLQRYLTPSRVNGLLAVIRTIQQQTRRYL
ncbi:MAG: aminotransferase class V-fold PLP-dependent enzyme [Pseudomonadota bacterium]